MCVLVTRHCYSRGGQPYYHTAALGRALSQPLKAWASSLYSSFINCPLSFSGWCLPVPSRVGLQGLCRLSCPFSGWGMGALLLISGVSISWLLMLLSQAMGTHPAPLEDDYVCDEKYIGIRGRSILPPRTSVLSASSQVSPDASGKVLLTRTPPPSCQSSES